MAKVPRSLSGHAVGFAFITPSPRAGCGCASISLRMLRVAEVMMHRTSSLRSDSPVLVQVLLTGTPDREGTILARDSLPSEDPALSVRPGSGG